MVETEKVLEIIKRTKPFFLNREIAKISGLRDLRIMQQR